MNDITGFGSIQPLRTSGTPRVCAPQTQQSSESQAPEQHDLVSIGSHHELLSNDRVNSSSNKAFTASHHTSDTVNATANQLGNASPVQDFEGFLLAGSPALSKSEAPAPAVQVSHLGTIAMIDDEELPAAPVSAQMTVNGPSTISEGLFSMSGIKLA